MRTFDTGATRSDSSQKYDYSGFLDPLVLRMYAKYMHKHRMQTDGTMRESDNWKKGMPKQDTLKSLLRHVFELWTMIENDGVAVEREDGEIISYEDTLSACFFNVQALMRDYLTKSSEKTQNNMRDYLLEETVNENCRN